MFEKCLEIHLNGVIDDESQINYLLQEIGVNPETVDVEWTRHWVGDSKEGIPKFVVRYHTISLYTEENLDELEKKLKNTNYFLRNAINKIEQHYGVLRGGAESTACFNPLLP
jgi:hypothetical protein